MKGAAARVVVLVGAIYLVAGLVLGALAGQAATQEARGGWRLAAWIVSAIAFGAHIVYEQVRLRSAPRITAFRVSLAAALGAFGLAVAANIHALNVSSQPPSRLLILSLAIWPVMTMLPAFVVALIATALLAFVRRRVGGARGEH